MIPAVRHPLPRPYHVVHLLPDLMVGGGQQVVLTAASHLDPQLFKVSVWYMAPHHPMRPLYQRAGIPTLCLGYQGGLRDGARTLLRLVQGLRREHVALLHVHSSLDKGYGLLAGVVCRVPVVVHLHMPHNYRKPHSVLGRWRAGLRGWMHSLAVKHYIAVSEDVKRAHLPFRPGRIPVNVVYNGIEAERFRPPGPAVLTDLRRELGLADQGPVLVNVAMLRKHKGQRWLIEMMPWVLQRYPQARLLIVGDGEERMALEGMVRDRGLGQAVRFLGVRHDVPHLLALAQVFLFPSLGEGLGIAALEAMAAARPVVAFRLPVLEEFIEDGVTGYLATPEDPVDLAQKALLVLSNPRLAEAMGQRGRRVVEERFTVQAAVSRLESIYLSLLSRGPGTGWPRGHWAVRG